MNELSIIIPCISSVDIIPELIDSLAMLLMVNPSDIDVIVVVNENVPAVGRVVHFVRKKYPWMKFEMLQRKGNVRNYGALVRFGMAYSTSRYVVFVSSYGQDDVNLITLMLNKIRNGVQVVQATRYASFDDAKNVQLRFKIYQSIYRILTKILLGFKISDSSYGFKMFDRVYIQALGITQNGYSVSPEITLKALLAGGRVEYISSSIKSTPLNTGFKLYREGIGYLWLLIRGFAHRIGILWF